jgi:tyrosine-protein kinase Etk/Wzc
MPEEYIPPPFWDESKNKNESLDLIAILNVVVVRWPFIVAMAIAGLLISFSASFLLAPQFTCEAIFLPPTQRVASGDNPLAALLKAPSVSVYSGLLTSKAVLEDVVDHLNLQTIFKSNYREDAASALNGMAKVSTDSAGFVKLQVTNRDPMLAKEIAENFLQALSRLNDRMAISEAAQERHIYEVELQREKNDLENAEVELKKAQESTGVVMPQSQMQAGLSAIDTIRAQLRARQVVLAILLQAHTDQSPEVVRARSEIGALEGQLHRLETGSGNLANDGLSASRAPALNLEFVRLEREVKYHQLLFDVMAKQFEGAKIQEFSAAPGIQVVDFPELPHRKSSPKRSLFALGGLIIGVFLALLAIFLSDRRNAIRQSQTGEASLQSLSHSFRNARFRL